MKLVIRLAISDKCQRLDRVLGIVPVHLCLNLVGLLEEFK